jgi:riboflavin synthase
MFTGLIADIGTLRRLDPRGDDVTLEIATDAIRADALVLGESVAVNGACLTVTSTTASTFTADASIETLRRTSLGSLAVGHQVHLEQALRVGDRLGGHWVQGHVDGVGSLARRSPAGRAWDLWFDVERAMCDELVPKGSVAVDGVSLTVNEVGEQTFRVTIVPHTEAKTLLLQLAVGARVNIETDVIGKYVRRFLGSSQREGLGDLLSRFGYQS